MSVQITGARAVDAAGVVVATLDRVPVGGGVQVKTVDGEPVEFVHEASETWHVRLISPDPRLPDQLVEADSYESAFDVAEAYVGKLAEQADTLAGLSAALKA